MFTLSKRAKQGGIVAAGVAALGIATIVVVTSIGQSSPSTPTGGQQLVPELEIGEIRSISLPDDISLPLDEFRPDAESENAVLKAEHQLTQECMQRFGMSFDGPAWSVPAKHRDYDRLFGAINLDEAQKFGYQLPGESPSESGLGNLNPEEVLPPNVSEADYMAAFMGEADAVNGVAIPDGGCVGEARAALGDDYRLQLLIEEGVNYSLTQSNRDPRVTEAFAAWSVCMSDAGYAYETPSDAVNDSRLNLDTVSGVQAQIDIAVADVQCKIDTDLTGIRVAVASAWQDEFIKDHAAELEESAAAFQDQVTLAGSIG